MKRQSRGEDEHRAKVNANENTVINGAARLDPDDQSTEANRIRETAADIKARRAASN